jgi:hypothetical protein
MSTVRERCSCGARIEIDDAPLPNALASLTAWRKNHNCKHLKEESVIEATVGGTSFVEQPIGFTAGMNLPAREYDPFEERRS